MEVILVSMYGSDTQYRTCLLHFFCVTNSSDCCPIQRFPSRPSPNWSFLQYIGTLILGAGRDASDPPAAAKSRNKRPGSYTPRRLMSTSPTATKTFPCGTRPPLSQ